MEGCFACDLTSGRVPLPGGLIAETERWLVEHCVGPLGLGTLIVKPRRHVVHVSELDPDESVELGPLLVRVAGAVERYAGAEQVYVTLWSHMGGVPVHIHFVAQPIRRAQMDEFGEHGPRLQVAMFERGEPLDDTDVAAVADELRLLLAR